MTDLGQDSRAYKITEATQSTASLDDCYCCGNPAVTIVEAIGFPGVARIGLCGFCLEGKFEMVNRYLEFVCPFCDSPHIGDMVYYWKAIDVFNEHTGQNRRGTNVGRKGQWARVDWKEEIEQLRIEYCNIMGI